MPTGNSSKYACIHEIIFDIRRVFSAVAINQIKQQNWKGSALRVDKHAMYDPICLKIIILISNPCNWSFFFDHFVFVARRSAAAMLLLLLGTPWGFHKDGKRFSVWLCVMEDLSSFWKQVLQLLPFYCLTLPPLSSAAVHQWSLLYGKQMANSSVFDWGVMTDMLGSCSFTA